MKSFSRQAGVGLIEVLIAVLVLSVSLLAIASLQTRSLQFNQSAYWRSQANIFAQDMFELLRANRNNAAQFNAAFGANPAHASAQAWVNSIGAVIPGGQGSVACLPGPAAAAGSPPVLLCTVAIQWVENVSDDDNGNALTTTFTYRSSI